MQIIIHCHRISSDTLLLKWQIRLKIRSYCTVLITLLIWLIWLSLKSLYRMLLKTLINKVLLKLSFNDYISEIKTSAFILLSLTVMLTIHIRIRRLRSQHCWLRLLISFINFSSLWTLLIWIWKNQYISCR